MKYLLFSLLPVVFSITFMHGQDIGIAGIYAGSNYNSYHHTYGYGIEYYFHHSSARKLGIRFQHAFCRGEFDRINNSGADPFTKYIQKVQPDNQRISLRINYLFAVLKHQKSSVSIGPEFGLNFFFVNESYYQYEYGNSPEGYWENEDIERYRPGYGLLLEFQVDEVIGNNISAFTVINPEITTPENYGQDGVPNANLNTWMNLNLGLRLFLGKKDSDK